MLEYLAEKINNAKDWKDDSRLVARGSARKKSITPPKESPAQPKISFSRPTSLSEGYPISENQNSKGLAALHVLVLTLFLVGIIVVFFAMVSNANLKEFKLVRTNFDVMYTSSFGSLLKSSLETSWKTIATQVMFDGLESRFDLPEYLYDYRMATATPALPDKGGCAKDNTLCLPSVLYANEQLRLAINKLVLPSQFEILSRGKRDIRFSVSLPNEAALPLTTIEPLSPQAAVPGVTRELSVSPQGTTKILINVKLKVVLGGTKNYEVNESFPSNAELVTASVTGGGNTQVPGIVRWLCLIVAGNCKDETFSYSVAVPYNEEGTYKFSGSYFIEGVTGQTPATIAGSNSIKVLPAKLARDLHISADSLTASINQPANIAAGTTEDTTIKTIFELKPSIKVGLSRVLGAAVESVSVATRLRAVANTIAEKDGREPRSKFIALGLDRLFDSNFDNVRAILTNAGYRMLASMSSNGGALKLDYDARVVLSDEAKNIPVGGLTPASTGAGPPCSGLGTDAYDKYAGAIEQADPDQLLPWVEQPRALLAAIAETMSEWNQSAVLEDAAGRHRIGLFAVPRTDAEPSKEAHENAVQAVASLKTSFESVKISSASTESTLMQAALQSYAGSSFISGVTENYAAWKSCIGVTNIILPTREQSVLNPNGIFGPDDYANWLRSSIKTQDIRVYSGDSFCSSSDYTARGGKYLAYDFYSDSEFWGVYPAYPGKVVKIDKTESAWDGCGGAVWIQTGDFIVSYGHIRPSDLLAVGKDIKTTQFVGTVSKYPYQICANPHLQVMIYSPTWTFWQISDAKSWQYLNACGTQIECRYSDENNVPAVPGQTIQTSTASQIYRHCGALEWDALFRPFSKGRYWRLRDRNEWETAPAELTFKMADSFDAVDCALQGEGRWRWQNENDLLCLGGKLYSCGVDVPGATRIEIGQGAGGAAGEIASATGQYTCAGKDFLKSPGSPHGPHTLFSTGKLITKWCLGAELDRDWLCCTGQGKAMSCTFAGTKLLSIVSYRIEDGGEALVCEGVGSCS